jgi:hypothetical protein
MTETLHKIKGEVIHVVIKGDKKHNAFYGVILNPEHTYVYGMTKKFDRIETLTGSIEQWAKTAGVKKLVWVAKLKK